MKYIKTHEQVHNQNPILRWDILKFLSRRKVACSIHEILGNFPNETKTKEALKSLSNTFLVDQEGNEYKITSDGESYVKFRLDKTFGSGKKGSFRK